MNIISRVKGMLLSPKTEWEIVNTEPPVVNPVITGYVVPLIVLNALAAFIGYGLIGQSIMGVHFSSITWGLYYAIVQLVTGIAGVVITAYVVDALAPSFGSEKHLGRSVQLVAYGGTPALIAGLFSIIPTLASLVALAGAVYAVYVWYLGMGPVKKTPEDKKVVYLVVTFLVLMVVYVVIGAILGLILKPVFVPLAI